jgi:DNA-binding sugar fermentation-stimulating protein
MNTHREFGVALEEAQKAGVKVLMLECNVSENEIKIHCGGTIHEN